LYVDKYDHKAKNAKLMPTDETISVLFRNPSPEVRDL